MTAARVPVWRVEDEPELPPARPRQKPRDNAPRFELRTPSAYGDSGRFVTAGFRVHYVAAAVRRSM
jgi:hypothetical protein